MPHFVTLVIVSCVVLTSSALPHGLGLARLRPGSSGLARYRLTLDTFWTEASFPKQYPLFRPPAQWGSLLGRTHSSDFLLWRLGETVESGFKEFVEKGEMFDLDLQIQGQKGVFDAFKGSNIESGAGQAWVEFFVDRNHPLISVANRMIPSPDWFIGLNSVNLYDVVKGTWRQTYTEDMTLLDAGTDKGFTFSSPNWAEDPTKPVSAITAHFPDHPANSFYYPEMDRLPTIARVSIQLLQVYEDPNDQGTLLDEKDVEEDPVASEFLQHGESLIKPGSNAKEVDVVHVESEVRKESGGLKLQMRPDVGGESTERPQDDGPVRVVTEQRRDRWGRPRERPAEESPGSREDRRGRPGEERPTEVVAQPRRDRLGRPGEESSDEVTPGSREDRWGRRRDGTRRENRRRPQHVLDITATPTTTTTTTTTTAATERYLGPIDCVLGHWSEWSSCSKTCGYGYRTKTRETAIPAQNGGRPCAVETEEEMCGSMRNCGWNHFKFSQFGWPADRR